MERQPANDRAMHSTAFGTCSASTTSDDLARPKRWCRSGCATSSSRMRADLCSRKSCRNHCFSRRCVLMAACLCCDATRRGTHSFECHHIIW